MNNQVADEWKKHLKEIIRDEEPKNTLMSTRLDIFIRALKIKFFISKEKHAMAENQIKSE